MPAQQQTYDDQNPPISQAVQIWGEGPEIVPYAAGFVPPYPEAMIANYSGYPAVSASGGNGSGSSSSVPTSYDLRWTAGDTAQFDFFFPGACWTPTQPTDSLGLTWVQTDWQSQVRSPTSWWWGYWWPPVWPGYPFIMAFTVTATLLPSYLDASGTDLGPGTLVHLKGGTIWPGKFVWDLQTTQPDPADATATVVHTWYSGNVTVDPQVTQPDLLPPSNWPVYPYP